VISFLPYPEIKVRYAESHEPNALDEIEKTMSPSIDSLLPKENITGIFVSYGGFLASSNIDGMVSFPRRHDNPAIHILVTDKITPVIMINNTIHHWELEVGTPAAMYTARREKDIHANLFYWRLEEAPMPENNRIPIDTILIFTNPKNIYIPLGITPVPTDPISGKPPVNLRLPEIYVKSHTKQAPESLYVLNIRYWFGPVRSVYKTTPTSYIELLNP
jgi:hypothetical protein